MKTLFSILMLIMATTPSLFSAEAVSARLQQALFEEEANQNLEAAISAYQSILKAHNEERRLAATARFRLGECYRKLGRTNDAANQYQQVLRSFAEQTNLVRLSEQNLFALGRPTDRSDAIEVAARRPSARERALIEEEIALTEKAVARNRELIQKNLQAVDSEIPQRQALSRLRRELASIDDPAGPEVKQLLEEEIALQQKLVQRQQELIRQNLAASESDFDLQKDLLSLKRQQAALGAGPVQRADARGSSPGQLDILASKPDLEAIEIARLNKLIEESPDLINTRSETPPLHLAMRNHQRRVAAFLLDQQADVNLLNRGGYSALHLAVQQGDRGLVELLVERHADVNLLDPESSTPLLIAVKNGFKSIVELLLAHRANISAADQNGSTALHLAAAGNKKEIAEVLLANRADVSASSSEGTPLHVAISSKSFSIAKLLLSRGAPVDAKGPLEQTPLVVAVSLRNEELVDLLLKQNAAPDARYRSSWMVAPDSPSNNSPLQSSPPQSPVELSDLTPLMWASYDGQTSIVQRLLRAGAEVNAVDSSGSFALLWSVRRDQGETAALLLQNGAEVNLTNRNGYTPLGTAAFLGREALVRTLLDRGADPNLSAVNEPALNGAVRYRHKAVIELLLDRGANISGTDRNGQTALDLAKGGINFSPNGPRSRTTPPPRGYNAPSIEPAELVALLRKRGASEYVPRAGLITVSRVSRGFSQAYLFRGNNPYNRHTLLELIAVVYGDFSSRSSPNLAFPDLANIRISRRAPNGKDLQETKVNLTSVLESGDLPLEWGDVVEIPELDHRANDNWGGLSSQEGQAIDKALSRVVEIRIKGETNRVQLTPWGNNMPVFEVPSPTPNFVITISPTPNEPAPVPKRLAGFRLKAVLQNSGLLRVSSDLTRVKVTRTDPNTKQVQELLFDLTNVSDHDRTVLSLQNGDVIEVPERG